MCYRFVREATVKEIAEYFDIENIEYELEPSYNIAPGYNVAAVYKGEEHTLSKMKWGLIPPWAKDTSIGYRMANARGETITEKRSFKSPFKKRRCLIPATGFYEWRKEEKNKIPVYISPQKEQIFGFAGIWENWISPEGKEIRSCSIITMESKEGFQELNNRSPVIISPDDYITWLDRNLQDEKILQQMLKPIKPDQMKMYDVTTKVNSPKFNEPECILPV